VQEHFDDLVIATYGRGFWIIDDLTPLQQLTPEVAASDAHLFDPRDAYRFRPVGAPFEMTNDPTVGENPPYGASLNYWLGTAGADVELVIADAAGETVRTLEGSSEEGINRVWWNLQGEPSTEVKLRTPPLYAPWQEVGDDGERPIVAGRVSILQPPGTYTVTLKVDGEDRGQAELVVLKDPNSEGTEADIRAQVAFLESVRSDVNRTADMINRTELLRKQLGDLDLVLGTDEGDGIAALREDASGIDDKLIEVEKQVYQVLLSGTGQDRVRWPAKVYGRLTYLAGGAATADFRPTDQDAEVHAILVERLERALADLEAILSDDLPALNERLRAANLPNVIAAR